jgi:uncharacterized membrane protein HdeD (DUF308 family)
MKSVKTAIKQATGTFIGWAVIMIVLGLLAMILPKATGIAVSVVVSWLIVLAGLAHFASAFTGRDAGAFIWRMLIGMVYIVGGGYLAFHPNIALETFTVVLVAIFLLEGVLEIVTFFLLRIYSGSGWILFHGLVAIMLAYLISIPWPDSSTWAVGIVLGINLIVSGFTVLMYALAVRNTTEVLNP